MECMEHSTTAKRPQLFNSTVSNLLAIRRDNLRLLKDKHGGQKIAEMLNLKQSSFISQMAGPNPSRDVTEKTVRMLEKQLDLEVGTLDRPLGEAQEKSVSAEKNIAMVTAVIRIVGNICGAESVDLPINKLTDITALTIVDAMEHGGNLREEHLRQVVRLLK